MTVSHPRSIPFMHRANAGHVGAGLRVRNGRGEPRWQILGMTHKSCRQSSVMGRARSPESHLAPLLPSLNVCRATTSISGPRRRGVFAFTQRLGISLASMFGVLDAAHSRCGTSPNAGPTWPRARCNRLCLIICPHHKRGGMWVRAEPAEQTQSSAGRLWSASLDWRPGYATALLYSHSVPGTLNCASSRPPRCGRREGPWWWRRGGAQGV
jgi:hypothetical protein